MITDGFPYSSRIESLKLYRDCAEDILSEVNGALNFLQQLENNYNLVSKKTGELHDACEHLVYQQVRSPQIKLVLMYFM